MNGTSITPQILQSIASEIPSKTHDRMHGLRSYLAATCANPIQSTSTTSSSSVSKDHTLDRDATFALIAQTTPKRSTHRYWDAHPASHFPQFATRSCNSYPCHGRIPTAHQHRKTFRRHSTQQASLHHALPHQASPPPYSGWLPSITPQG